MKGISWFADNNGGVGPGNVKFTSVPITINALPQITSQPSGSTQTLCTGASATNLSVTATGSGITYQWYSNATASNSGGIPVTGATGATYKPSTTSAGTLYYYCVVSGICAPAVTSNISGAVIVNESSTISLTSANNNQTFCISNSVSPIIYAIGGSATGASASGLPAGVSGSYNAGVFTIAGTPSVSGVFPFTVNTTGSLCPNIFKWNNNRPRNLNYNANFSRKFRQSNYLC